MLLNSCEDLEIQFSPFVLLPVDNFVSVSVNKCMYFKVIPVLKLSNCCDYLGRLGDVILPFCCCLWGGFGWL